ncbi:hypothetical protein [Vibrio gallicus]|uniref:hypothetical protein n=1 Tax=Vibrio gallicus TaxID=190897 RepID=UPI0021C2BBCF|nr:hypothetical protein [Vibrio gallicus]
MLNYASIDIPFNLRHCCWFCGEPSYRELNFPIHDADYTTHIPLAIPACDECHKLAGGSATDSIWNLRLQLKNALMKRYAKHLGIGVNWTKQELQQTQLEGTAFKGFTESAWAMYEIAKQRIEFEGWPLSANGIPLEIVDDSYAYEFEGKKFLNFDAAIEFFQRAESLNKSLFEGLVAILGQARFDYALKIARIYTSVTRSQVNEILEEIEQQETERRIIFKEQQRPLSKINSEAVHTVKINKVVVSGQTIGWAMARGIDNLTKLEQSEDAFFEQHQHLGGIAAFQAFDGLQVYLNARVDAKWVQSQDPNQRLWAELLDAN